jgi:adenylate cyclase
VGINLGDVVVDGGDLQGDGVIVAARLEALCNPGGIYVSGAVADQVTGKLPFTLRDLGEQQLKNMTRPVRVYCLDGDEPQHSAFVQRAQLPTKPSIAVLPFSNHTGDAGDAYLADGITDEIMLGLGRFHDLFVTGQGSTSPYKNRNADIRQVARDLGVRYVVKGSLRKLGGNLRITVDLADASSGNQIWAENYDLKQQDTFAVQDEIIRSIVGTVTGRVRDEDSKRALHKGNDELAAYDLLLRGRYRLAQWTKDEIVEARKLFEQAIALDPDNSAAYADLADTYLMERQSDWTDDPQVAGERAFELARKSVALDDSDAKARRTLAGAYLLTRSDFQMASLQLANAVSLNPNEYWNFCAKSFLTTMAGDSDAGISCSTEAIRLNPFAHDGCLESQFTAAYCARRYEEAIAAVARMSAPRPTTAAGLAACYAQLGRDADARRAMADFLAEASKVMAHYPGDDPVAWRAYWARLFPFQRSADLEHMLDGFRKAGLPV